jgi:intein/homing endonuclease
MTIKLTPDPTASDQIPRRKTSSGGEGGPLVIPPGAQPLTGKKQCPTCKRMVATVPKLRKGSCKCLWYQRTTTFIDVLQDEYLLKQWGNRNVAWGMSQRPDLVLAASSCKRPSEIESGSEDYRELNNVVAEAQREAGDKIKATIGTSLHKLTHMMDRGDTLGTVPARWQPDLDAYAQWSKDAGVEWVSVESFRVGDWWVKHIDDCDHKAKRYGGDCDCYGVAGTVDRIGWYRGRLRIFDIKGLALDTKLPTPSGWTTMRDVSVGDQVLDESGKACKVTMKSSVKNIGTYTVSFNDGSTVVCDTEHIWWTRNAKDRRKGLPPQARSINEIIETLKYGGQSNHNVPVADALQLSDADLPADPYLLGVWIGDGHVNRNVITKQDDLFDVIASDGWELGVRQVDKRSSAISRSVVGFHRQMESANVIGNKHIPAQYFRASVRQRTLLLQGLMDTDGTWNTTRRRAVFNSTNKALAYQVSELLITLGQKPSVNAVKKTGYKVTVTDYAVEFTPTIMPFRLPRKAKKVNDATPVNLARASSRMIVNVEVGPNVETACIAVDSPNNVYLCGESMIPTHNTGSDFNKLGHAMQLAAYAHMVPYEYPGDTRGSDEIDLDVGYIIYLPEGKGEVRIEAMDLRKGWAACELAKQVWDARKFDVVLGEEDTHDTLWRLVMTSNSLAALNHFRRIWKEDKRLTPEIYQVMKDRAAQLRSMGVTK